MLANSNFQRVSTRTMSLWGDTSRNWPARWTQLDEICVHLTNVERDVYRLSRKNGWNWITPNEENFCAFELKTPSRPDRLLNPLNPL
jgi:hypothetical protein